VLNPGTTLAVGPGNDTVNVSPTARNLDGIRGSLTLIGGAGTDTLNVFDQSNPRDDTYTMNAGSVTRTGSALISYGNAFDFMNINGGSGTNTYNVNGTMFNPGTTLATGPGNAVNTVNVRGTNGLLNVVGGGLRQPGPGHLRLGPGHRDVYLRVMLLGKKSSQ
jgi:hypothetical protein